MTLGRRPPEEGGHQPIRLSLNAKARSCLDKVHEIGGNRSQFVEQAIDDPCRVLVHDPRFKPNGSVLEKERSEGPAMTFTYFRPKTDLSEQA
jgi:hypothetical protein